MNSKQIEAGLLVNEWQLGTQLNVAVANGTRDKFNLLLSLLSDDARDFSQFDTPKATQASLNEVELRESLALGEAQPLVNEGLSLPQAKQINSAVQQGHLCDARLHSLLNNEALLSRTHKANFDTDVVDNLSFLAQTRLKQTEIEAENAGASLNGIDHTLMEKYQAMNLESKPLQVSYN
ncbi:hypothetical protein GCM10007916_08460 [Psychromonas marina]|uniref:Uncharacterized protein n=1 Tax=Psychromonas marina TaxID=88364 RepID=A0ABQ6DXA0_9GAMM|nr:VC2046/SO_2500 family protein [Psychromonas marina]GLS89779.1 hypothetical protein GCM10007916_08460 [Psychromonas marina]